MVTILYNIYRAANWFIELISLAILVYCILTWIAPRSRLCDWLGNFTEPFVAPFRRLTYAMMRRWGSPFDFSCWFAMIAINIASRLLWQVFSLLMRLF